MGLIAYKLKDYHARFHTKYLADAIFVHINKTGGTSIEKALGLPFQHRTARELRAVLGERRWESRFSFAFVRNPWDKVASHYSYRVKTNQTGLRERTIPFGEWVRLTYGEQAAPYYDQPKMFMPQLHWIADESGRILVDFVGRFESLEGDFQTVCGKLGRTASLPHLKQSSAGDYRRLYDDQTAEIVGRWFAADLEAFGYRFD
jgi:hypothetical protein